MNSFASLLDTGASWATAISAVFALAMIVWMAVLYWRRHNHEEDLVGQRVGDMTISRSLLVALAANDDPLDLALVSACDGSRARRVIIHLLQLVRGNDGQRLSNLAERSGLLDAWFGQLGQPRTSQRVDAMRMLEQFPGPRTVAALTGRMRIDSDPSVRLEAAAGLARIGRLPPPRTIIDTLDLTQRPTNRLHEAIFRAAARDNVAELITLSHDLGLGPVRAQIVESLGWSEDFSVLATLARHASDAKWEVRCAVLRAARRLGHPAVEPWATAMLLDPVDEVRIQAARTSGTLGFTRAIPVLATLVENPSWWVRTRAAQALALLRPLQAAPVKMTGLRQ